MVNLSKFMYQATTTKFHFRKNRFISTSLLEETEDLSEPSYAIAHPYLLTRPFLSYNLAECKNVRMSILCTLF